MEAYLDNAATTRVLPEVREKMVRVFEEDYGNPSSMHLKGVAAENVVRDAAVTLAKILKTEEKEIVFTSGGTESNNLAIIGTAMANQRSGKHIITTAVEHASVLNTMAYLEEQGFKVTYLPVDQKGVVDLEALKAALDDETILVSVMYVNNEVGARMPVEEIGRIIKEKRPDILFHVDATQAFGKMEIYPKRQHIDLLSVSGHKIHGPKGSGFLYVRDKVKIKPLLHGGGQQRGLRSGTENVPAIAGLSVAAGLCYDGLFEEMEKLYGYKDEMIRRLCCMEEVCVNSSAGKESAPHIVNASFLGIRSEVMLHALEEKGIYVSAGSACSSHKRSESATLKAMGLSKEARESALRFSFCRLTTREEIEETLAVIEELLPKLRRYTRR